MVQIQRKLDVFVLFYGAYKGVSGNNSKNEEK